MAPHPRRNATQALVDLICGSDAALRALDPAAWSLIPVLAEAHGLAGLAPQIVASGGPLASIQAVRDLETRTRARSIRLAHDREAIAIALEAADVPFCFVKGAWLAELGLAAETRPAADIDLVAPAHATPDTRRALASLGYRLASRSARHRVYLRPGNHAVVDPRGEHPDNPRPVEVHTRLQEAFRGVRLDLTASVPIGRVLPLALGFVHLAAHATGDALGRKLRGVALIDMVVLARSMTDADWHAFQLLTGSPHAARFAWPALEWAATQARAPIPFEFRAKLESLVTPQLATWVRSQDLDSLSRPGRVATRRQLGEIPRIWPIGRHERLTVWRAILWPKPSELADRYPAQASSRLWPLMYARHAGYNAAVLVQRWRLRG